MNIKNTNNQPKIAFLITAYNNFDQLNIFINQLLEYSESYIYLHIDKKVDLDIDIIIENRRVVVIPDRIEVNWGDSSQVDSIIKLFKYVDGCKINFDYVSLHSGADLAIKPIHELAAYLEKSGQDAWLDCNPLPIPGWGHGGGIERIKLHYPRLLRQKVPGRHPIRYIRSIYQRLFEAGIIKGKELPGDIQFYGGTDWFTISADLMHKTLEYLSSNDTFNKIFYDSLVGSEIFFNTLFLMIGDRDKIAINNNLRLIDWTVEDISEIGSPKTLTIDDLPKIKSSKAFFARKLNINKDAKIVDEIIKLTTRV